MRRVADLQAVARDAAAVASSLARRSESGRRLEPEVVEVIAAGGLHRLCVPAELGGPEVDPVSMVDALATVSAGDGAAGWCAMIASTSSAVSLAMAPDAAAEIYGDPGAWSGGAYAPGGRGVREGDGWRVTGRWAWGSGTDHCDWIMGGTLCDAGGGFRLCLVPASEVDLEGDWDSSGLRGTASGHFSIDGALVPESRTVPFPATPATSSPLARFPLMGLLAAGVASVSLGIGRRAIDELVDLAAGKIPLMASKTLATSPHTHLDVARAEAVLGAGRAFLRDELARAWEVVGAGDEIDVTGRTRLRLAAWHATTAAADAVDLAYDAGGGTSVDSACVLQRCFRDVHTATQHAMVGRTHGAAFGRHALGQSIDTALL